MYPIFLVVGAPKAGTTSRYNYLGQPGSTTRRTLQTVMAALGVGPARPHQPLMPRLGSAIRRGYRENPVRLIARAGPKMRRTAPLP